MAGTRGRFHRNTQQAHETTTSYYHFNGRRLAMRKEGVVQYLLGDHLSTTSVVLNSSGTKVAESRHYPYGGERWSSGAMPTDYRWTGQRSDGYIKLYLMGARWYDSALGRWISADTLVPDPSNPQSLNRYSYVKENPLRYIDPTGHRDSECGILGQECSDDPQADDPSPPPEFYPPFSDAMAGPERHLVESCDPLDCPEAMFNPYTPGGWDFRSADNWYVATSQVYNAGPVSLSEAQQAAREGRPNPVTSEQMSEGLKMRPNQDFPAESYLTMYIRLWLPYYYFFKVLGWKDHEGMAMSNFEPRYLETLLTSHPWAVSDAYPLVLYDYHANPEAFLNSMNPWKMGVSKR